MFIKKIGIDLGTINTLVFVPKKGIIINEPSVVSIDSKNKKPIAIGNAAKDMIGRNPEEISVLRPLKNGVIADYTATEAMLSYFISKTTGNFKFLHPEIMISVPSCITSTEKKAVIDATISAGAKSDYIIKEAIASAIGAGIPIGDASGRMIIDIGGGTTEIAVVSLGGVVVSNSVKIAGNKFDLAIIDYIKKQYNFSIGERTAEFAKIKVGNALFTKEKSSVEVTGTDVVTGLPKNFQITSEMITTAIQEELKTIIEEVKKVLHDIQPELSSDIMENGITLTGGSASLKNIDKLFINALGIKTVVAENPSLTVIKGISIVLDHLNVYKKSIFTGRG